MLRIVARLKARPSCDAGEISLNEVMPALCIATSVPVPIAMPTSRLRERRRVIDAITGHRHHSGLRF